MIDSVALVWGHSTGTAPRRARGVAERVSPPVHLDFADLSARLGSDEGEVTVKVYRDGPRQYGHWKVDSNVDFMYRPGRLELRASLPKVLLGRNDVVLDERGVHDGLRKLVRIGEAAAGHALTLHEAVPSRLDYAYQWDVPSVAAALDVVKVAYQPRRKLRTENVSPKGGRSVSWGYGGKRVVRFYDKGAEIAEREAREVVLTEAMAGVAASELDRLKPDERERFMASLRRKAAERFWREAELDTHLRFEIQERRRDRLRLIHDLGYTGSGVRAELEREIAPLAETAQTYPNLTALLDSYGDWPHAFAYAVASLHLAGPGGDALWPIAKSRLHRNSYRRWKERSREAALAVAAWSLRIPADAFEAESVLWAPHELAEAA